MKMQETSLNALLLIYQKRPNAKEIQVTNLLNVRLNEVWRRNHKKTV